MKQFLAKLMEALKESTITQTLLVLLVFGPLAYCTVAEITIPQQYNAWASMILGFFFGAKSAYQIMKGR